MSYRAIMQEAALTGERFCTSGGNGALVRHHHLRQKQQFLPNGGPLVHFQSRVHLLHVRASGIEAQPELVGDFTIALARDNQQRYFPLLRR